MIRTFALTASLGIHLVAWCVMHWPSQDHTTGHETTVSPGESRSVLQSALVEVSPQSHAAVPSMTPPDAEQVTPQPPFPVDEDPEPIRYASRQQRTQELSKDDLAGNGPSVRPMIPSHAEQEPGTGDLDQDGLVIPQLRIQKLNVELIERLIESRQARLVVISHGHPVSFVAGPLSRPLGVQTIEKQSELDGYSERMLEIPASVAQRVLAILDRDETSRDCCVRLALRTSFDRTLLQAQRRAVEAAGKPLNAARVTVGCLVLTPDNNIDFAVDEVR